MDVKILPTTWRCIKLSKLNEVKQIPSFSSTSLIRNFALSDTRYGLSPNFSAFFKLYRGTTDCTSSVNKLLVSINSLERI